MKIYKSKARAFDITLTALTYFFLIITIYITLFYHKNVNSLLLLLTVSACGLTWFHLYPTEYEFKENSLIVREPKPFKSTKIPYANIKNYHVKGNYTSMSAIAMNEVKIVFSDNNRTRYIVCYPKDIAGFSQTLTDQCGHIPDE